VDNAIPVRRSIKPRARTADPATWKSSSRSYGSWINMIYRCTKEDWPQYRNHGGRGITVCRRWLLSFDDFLADMGERPPGMTLDRKNNDNGYWCGRCPECRSRNRPGNCRWATPHQQGMNTRAFKLIPEVIAEIERLRATGLSMRAIGAEMKLNRKTVSSALSGKGRSRNPAVVNGVMR
jgi:hypothetical protein